MDAAPGLGPRPRARWPAAGARWGITPAVVAVWVAHLLIVGLAAAVPAAPAPGMPHPLGGLPWLGWDTGWYWRIARLWYEGKDGAISAAFWPGVPAVLAVLRWPLAALIAWQGLFLALLVQVGRLARAYGLVGWRVPAAQAFLALSPAALFLSAVYPECWMALGACGVLLALREGKPGAAAAWTALAVVMDPWGLAVGLPAVVTALRGLAKRDPATFRLGVRAGLGGVLAVAAVLALLAVRTGSPWASLTAQRHWVAGIAMPWAPVATALGRLVTTTPMRPAAWGALAALPLVVGGTVAVAKRVRVSAWHATVAFFALGTLIAAPMFTSQGRLLASVDRFWLLNVAAPLGLAGAMSRRGAMVALIWSGAWSVYGAVLFTHGYFWG